LMKECFLKGSCSCGVAMWIAILASREVKRNKPYRVRRMGEDVVFWKYEYASNILLGAEYET